MLRLSVAKCGHRLMENDSIRKEINRLVFISVEINILINLKL
ncbi:hypothetical protein [Clostridium perfringens]|nr:hypothetical protein [Clostridium perfringens]